MIDNRKFGLLPIGPTPSFYWVRLEYLSTITHGVMQESQLREQSRRHAEKLRCAKLWLGRVRP